MEEEGNRNAPPRSSRCQEALSVVLIVIVAAAAALVVLEVYFRFFYTGTAEGTILLQKRWEEDHVRLNGQGFRADREYSPERPDGVALRLLAVGDSFAFGQGVEVEEGWPAQLELELNRRRPDRPTEVLNVSARGWDLDDYATALEKLGQEGYRYDGIVLGLTMNDLPEGCGHEIQSPKLFDSLRQDSIIIDLLFAYVLVLTSSREGEDGAPLPYHEECLQAFLDPVGSELLLTTIGRLQELARSSGGWLEVVVFTFISLVDEPPPWMTEAHLAVQRQLEAAGVARLDLTDLFRQEGQAAMRISFLDEHPSPRAHALAAARIADWLESGAARSWANGGKGEQSIP